MKNVAYLRVSTDAQTEKFGLDVQHQKIEEYCKKEGVTIDKYYVDGGYSGSNLERPEIKELLKDAEMGKFNNIYIYKLDRVSRDAYDSFSILYDILPKYNINIISVTETLKFDTPMDKITVGLNVLMNQYEREVIYMRTRAGMLERVKKGLWMGGGNVPYGYSYDRNDGILHPIPEQVEKIKEAFELYLEGYSCYRISEILGFKGDRIVSQILKRKCSIGLIEYKGEVYKGLHEPIISEELFYKTQEMIKKRSNKSFVSNANLLTGLCRCGICGQKMRYIKWSDKPRLFCYSQDKSRKYLVKDENCNNSRPYVDYVEKEVEDCFKQFAINISDEEKEVLDITEGIKNMIDKQNAKIKKLYSMYADRSSDNLLELINEEEKRLSSLKKELGEAQRKSIVINKKPKEIKRMADVWDDLSTKEKNKILKSCIEKVVLTNGRIEIFFNL